MLSLPNRIVRHHACWVAIAFSLLAQPVCGQDKVPREDWTPEHIGALLMDTGVAFRQDGGAGRLVDKKPVLAGFKFHATRDDRTAPLPKTATHRYWFHYPPLHEGDLIPFCDALYTVKKITTEWPHDITNVVTRLSKKDIPNGVELHEGKYVFPLQVAKDAQFWSGKLHTCYVYVWEIAPAKDKPEMLTAKVGILADADKYERHRDKEIAWNWFRVGEPIDIGGFRHTLTAIVPPKEPIELGREEGRLIGWIELDPEPLKEEKVSSDEPFDVGKTIDLLENQNAAPTIVRRQEEANPVFETGYDWNETARIERVIKDLFDHVEEAWPELLKHADDNRYSITVGHYGEPGHAANYDIGRVCQTVILACLREGYHSRVTGYYEYPRPLRYPCDLRSAKDIIAWSQAREKNKLYELQIEVAQWAISQLPAAVDLSALGVMACDAPDAQNRSTSAIQAEIEMLQSSKRPIIPEGFFVGGRFVYSEKKGK